MNENYPLAMPHDPDFDKEHAYRKSNGDGSPRGFCRCGRRKADPLHVLADPEPGDPQAAGDPESKRDSLGDPSQASAPEPDTFAMGEKLLSDLEEIQRKEAAGDPQEPELIPPISFTIIADIAQTVKVDKGSLLLEMKIKTKLDTGLELYHLARLIKQGGLTATIQSSQIVMPLPSEPGNEKDSKDS